EAGQDVLQELLSGAILVEEAAARAVGVAGGRGSSDAAELRARAQALRNAQAPLPERIALAQSGELLQSVGRFPDRERASHYPRILEITVDRPKARFSTWYELFPRSTADGGRHGRLRDAEARLPYVAEM